MKNRLTLLATVSVLAFGISACDNSRQRASALPEGEYEQTSTMVDSQGTKTVKKVSSDVDVDRDGDKKVVVESKVTKDPKGLLNKTTVSKTKGVTETEDGKTTSTYDREENSAD